LGTDATGSIEGRVTMRHPTPVLADRVRNFSVVSVALTLSLFASMANAGGEMCAAPGVQVTTDPAGDQSGGPTAGNYDIIRISIAEPAHLAGHRLIAATLQLTKLASPPPGSSYWWVHLDIGGADYWLGMRTPDPAVLDQSPVFEHGTVTNGSFSTDGPLDPSS